MKVPSLLSAGIWSSLSWHRACVCAHNCSIKFICVAVLLYASSSYGFYSLSSASAEMVPELWEEGDAIQGCNVDVPVTAEHPVVFYSLHLGHLLASVLITIY